MGNCHPKKTIVSCSQYLYNTRPTKNIHAQLLCFGDFININCIFNKFFIKKCMLFKNNYNLSSNANEKQNNMIMIVLELTLVNSSNILIFKLFITC